MIKVLQISKYYYPFIGGTEQVARDMAKAMNEMPDVEQKIICFNADASTDGFVCKQEETLHDSVDGVEVIRCGCQMKIASQSISREYAGKLKTLINEFDPDIIILHYPNPYVTRSLLRYKKKHCKLLVYWHLDITKQKFLKRFFYGQDKKLIQRSEKIIGATPIHIEQSKYAELFKNKSYIMPYMIDENSLIMSEKEKAHAAEIRQKSGDETICFFIGRHVPYKGLEHLIEAVKMMPDEKLRVYIAGTGALTDQLKQMAAGDERIVFLGMITSAEKRAYLKATDIFCFPSITRNEGFGLALAEAMYYGKPAITFHIDGSGVNYVNIANETGIECPNADSAAYAEAIRKLAGDRELREKYGEAARTRILENFTTDSFYKNMNKLIHSLVEK